jgi:hypothetical protein
MESTATSESVSLASWGFRITTSPCELEVVRDTRTYDSPTKKKRFAAVLLCILFACGYYVVEFSRIDLSHPISIIWTLPATISDQSLGLKLLVWMQLIFLPVLPLLIVWEMLYSGAVNLKCTRDTVQTTRMVFGKVRRILSFPKNDVTRFEYVDGFNPLNGRSGYLSFFVGERIIKCLPGLKCVEAKLILNELERMGFDVVSNPALATMVQIEQSRRHG